MTLQIEHVDVQVLLDEEERDRRADEEALRSGRKTPEQLKRENEAELPPLKIDETERIIARLEQVVRDRRVVLVGGQAVAIWASKLESRIADALVDAVASRDIDLLGSSSDL